jgi:hypothetical protein
VGATEKPEIKIDPMLMERGIAFLMGVFPAAWGHETRGISRDEAKAALEGALREMGLLSDRQAKSRS